MADIGRPIDEIVKELTESMTRLVADAETKFEILTKEQSRIFSTKVGDLNRDLNAQALTAQKELSEKTSRRLNQNIERIKETSENALKQVRNAVFVFAALLFAGTFVFLNEQREKATEKTIAFQNELIAAHTSVDTSVANLRVDVRDAESKMNDVKKELADADKELSMKQQQLTTASANLDRAKVEYENLTSRIKGQAK